MQAQKVRCGNLQVRKADPVPALPGEWLSSLSWTGSSFLTCNSAGLKPSFKTSNAVLKRNVIVLTNSLKHEEGCRAVSGIGNKVRPARDNGISITRAEAHFHLRITQE